MAAETQYTANTGMVKISTANSGLDGTGTLGTVLTGASNGTLIKTVTIKATGASTTQGMVRLFIYDGTNTRLIKEVDIPTMAPTATEASFETTLQLDYKLKSGYVLKASTQNGENFNIIAEGLDWTYYATSVRPESTNYTANTGMALISTANSNLDGSGTLGTALTAGASGSGWKGCCIDSINIKAIGATETQGMVRIYIQDSGGTAASDTFLLTEVPVPNGQNPSGTFQSFGHKIVFPQKLHIQAGYKIVASTQVAESYVVIVEGMDIKYPS